MIRRPEHAGVRFETVDCGRDAVENGDGGAARHGSSDRVGDDNGDGIGADVIQGCEINLGQVRAVTGGNVVGLNGRAVDYPDDFQRVAIGVRCLRCQLNIGASRSGALRGDCRRAYQFRQGINGNELSADLPLGVLGRMNVDVVEAVEKIHGLVGGQQHGADDGAACRGIGGRGVEA